MEQLHNHVADVLEAEFATLGSTKGGPHLERVEQQGLMMDVVTKATTGRRTGHGFWLVTHTHKGISMWISTCKVVYFMLTKCITLSLVSINESELYSRTNESSKNEIWQVARFLFCFFK